MKFEIDIKVSGKVSNGEVEIGLGGHDKVEEVLGGDGSALDEVVSIQQAFEKIWESNREMLDRLCSAFKPGISDDGLEDREPASHPHQGDDAGGRGSGVASDEVADGAAFFVVHKQDGKCHVKVSGYLEDSYRIHKGEYTYPVKSAWQDIIDHDGGIPEYMLSMMALRGLDEALDKAGLSMVGVPEVGEWEPVDESVGGSSTDKFFNSCKMKVKALL